MGTELQPAQSPESPPTGLNFYRHHPRVVLLLFLAPTFYEIWWYWQLFAFTPREHFPRARRFWWILVPFYGWVVLYRQFDDIKQAAVRTGAAAFNSRTAITLLILSWWAGASSNRISNVYVSLVLFVASGVLIAGVGYLVQPAANAYLKSKYPEAPMKGMTWGEITATVLGMFLFSLVLLGTFLPSA